MTNAIEQTKREMYRNLKLINVSLKKGFKPVNGMHHFEIAMEAHLEAQRVELCRVFGALGRMTQERDDIQGRLHAIDHKYGEQTTLVFDQAEEINRHKVALNIAGEELIRAQGVARQHLDDGRSAEKLSDSLDEQLRDARQVISHQEQLIVGQRLAIAELYMARREVS